MPAEIDVQRLTPKMYDPKTLVSHPDSFRIHTEAQREELRRSLTEHGWLYAALLNTRSGYVLNGRACIDDAIEKGIAEVPVVEIDVDSVEERKILARIDRIPAMAEFDLEALQKLLADLDTEGVDLDSTGWADFDFSAALNSEDHALGKTDPDSVPPPPAKATTRTGDVWLLGDHVLLCGDSTKEENLLNLQGLGFMEGNAHLLLTDPPYNVDYEGGTDSAMTIANDNMDEESFHTFLVASLGAAVAVLQPGGAFYIWHADSKGLTFRRACADVGLTVRQCLVWVKQHFVLGRQDYQWKHEPCLYGWKDGAAHAWFADRSQTTVLEFDKPVRNGEHPTMKPVPLFAYLIENSCKPGGIVLDPFGGSGTTLIAAEQTGRRARLIELDPIYCDVIVRRYEEFTGKTAYLQSDGRSFAEIKTARE